MAGAVLYAFEACQPRQSSRLPQTHVERGEPYNSGSSTHDEYFANVHDLQTAVAAAIVEERDVRMGLSLQLHLLPTAENEQVLQYLAQDLKKHPKFHGKIEDSAAGRRVKISPATEFTPDSATADFMRALEETCTGYLTISGRLKDIPDRARRMRDIGKALSESADKDFASQSSTRTEVAAELKASLRVLDEVDRDADEMSSRTRSFVDRALADLDDVRAVDASSKKPLADTSHTPAKKPKKQSGDFTP
jgi:hypothetical protein